MFPLNDFNLVCCAIATFTAAVGYRYSKRQLERRRGVGGPAGLNSFARRYLPRRYSSVSSISTATSTLVDNDVDCYQSDCPTPSDAPFDETEPGTLKRKYRDETPEYFVTEKGAPLEPPSLPPLKRLRSLSPEVTEDVDTIQLPVKFEVVGTPCLRPIELPPLSPVLQVTSKPSLAEMISETEIQPATPAAEGEKPPKLFTQPEITPTIPAPFLATKLESTFTIPACKPSTAFTAFVGSSSAFASSLPSPSSRRPAWCTDTSSENVQTTVESRDSVSGPTIEAQATPEPNPTLALETQNRSRPPVIPILTGEEEEDIVNELKGVKLFVKRGDGDFADGMLGHVKLLSNKNTQDERIVFRREPVWKVSMSVRLCPTVRCAFDEEQGILRITLIEKILESSLLPGGGKEHVVIYALRRGKTTKGDFTAFAKGLAKSTHLLASS